MLKNKIDLKFKIKSIKGYKMKRGNKKVLSYDKEEENYILNALKDTVTKCAKYVASITQELEKFEKENNEKRIKYGRNPHPLKWEGSTFKVNLVSGFIFTLFSVERVMKYNVVLFLPMKKWIVNRNEDFFLKANVYPGAEEKDIVFFRNLWKVNGALRPEEKKTIWKFWDTQLEIVEDWLELTGWKPGPDDDLAIPNIDYEEEAKRVGVDV